MKILVTNDDGISAPGLAALYSAVRDLGDAEVVAPMNSQSAVGHAISVLTPMKVSRVQVGDAFEGWSVEGRPADCVKLACQRLLKSAPDLLVSGINSGANTSINVLYSGTVAAAMEGAFAGIPSIAFSLELTAKPDYAAAGKIARRLIERLLPSARRVWTCLSVNIPHFDIGEPLGTRLCSQDTLPMVDHYHHATNELGEAVYWLDGRMPDQEHPPHGDLRALRERYVAITPLKFDLTDYDALRTLAEEL